MNSLKQTAASRAIGTLLSLATSASDQNVERFLKVLERIAPQPRDKEMVRSVQRQWAEDELFGPLLKRVLREMSPNCRERLVANFVLNNAWGPLAARREAFAAEAGFSPPTTILISPTMRCNLHCSDCYAGEYSKRDELSYSLMDRVLSEAEALGVFFVTVLGGEPFIRDDLWDLYEKHRDIYFQV